MSEPGGCCRCCFSFILTSGLTALFLWLSLRTSNPSCSIESFYLPALNSSQKSKDNSSLFFMVKLNNPNKDKGIHYDNVSLTFFDSPNRTHVIGNYTIPKFYQGRDKKAKKDGDFTVNVTTVSQAVFPNGSAVFRVDLATEVRFKIIAWKTKRHKINVTADVAVNNQGSKENKKGIKFKKSNARKLGCYNCLLVGVLLRYFVFFLLNFL